MSLAFPQADLPRGLGGGSDAWDDGPAGALLSGEFFPSPPAVDASASGATLTATASITANGASTADAYAGGVLLTATASLPAVGAASAQASASGATVTATAEIVAGAATGEDTTAPAALGLWLPSRKLIVPGRRLDLDRSNPITRGLIAVLDRSQGPGVRGPLRTTSWIDVGTGDSRGRRTFGGSTDPATVDQLPHSTAYTMVAGIRHGPAHETYAGILFGYWNSNSDNYLFGLGGQPAGGTGRNLYQATARTDNSYNNQIGTSEMLIWPGDEYHLRVEVTGWSDPGTPGYLHLYANGVEQNTGARSFDYAWPSTKTGNRTFGANAELGVRYSFLWNRQLSAAEDASLRRDPDQIYDRGLDWDFVPFTAAAPATSDPDLLVPPDRLDASLALPIQTIRTGSIIGHWSASNRFRNAISSNPSMGFIGDGKFVRGPYGTKAQGNGFVIYPETTWGTSDGDADWNSGHLFLAIIDAGTAGRLFQRTEYENTPNTSSWSVVSFTDGNALGCNVVTTAVNVVYCPSVPLRRKSGPIVVAVRIENNYLTGPTYVQCFGPDGGYTQADSGGDHSGLFRSPWSELFVGGRLANTEGIDTFIRGGVYAWALFKGAGFSVEGVQRIVRDTQRRLDFIASASDVFLPGAPAAGGGSSSGAADGVSLTATASISAGAATATASIGGATVSATASLAAAGAASGSCSAPGATFTATASLPTVGAATSTSNASGATLTATASLPAVGAVTAGSTSTSSTLTATASLAAVGAATGAASVSGATIAATASIIAGTATASSGTPAATLTATASIPTSGAATGAGSAAGSTVSASASILAGAATADGSASAPGVTLAASASLAAGAATAGSAAGGATWTAAGSLTAGAATGAGNAGAAVLAASSSILAGAASSTATIAGVTLTGTASIQAGAATGNGNASAAGATITATASTVSGAATGAGSAAGATVSASASLIAGAASASGDASAPGRTLAGTSSIAAGACTASSSVSGATLAASASLTAGAAGGSGSAGGVTLAATGSVIAGAATGGTGASAAGRTLTATASLAAGAANAASFVPGVVVEAAALFAAGAARGDGTAGGATISAVASLAAGGAVVIDHVGVSAEIVASKRSIEFGTWTARSASATAASTRSTEVSSSARTIAGEFYRRTASGRRPY